jgi:hypothetical protein
MAILKQVLITFAAAAVGVLASPLSADATATSTFSALEAAMTKISKPLEGKELEDFLANRPHIPEGSIDITNTTLATELIKFYEAHKNGTALTKRGASGACDQGDCPDFNAGFDFYAQHIVAPIGNTNTNYWAYWGRYNDCNQCSKLQQTSKDGCFDFTSCGRPQNICVDINNSRAHRIWKDNKAKECYRITRDNLGSCSSPVVESWVAHPVEKIACNW